LLNYLAARRFGYPIRVLDSSFSQTISENRETVARAGVEIVHQVFDPKIGVSLKIKLGTDSVETPYCSFCADDDVLLTGNLERLLDFLDANPAFVAAHGFYLNFKPDRDFAIVSTVYSAQSITANDALKRIVEQTGNYQATFYAVHRTSVMRSVLSQLGHLQSIWGQELLSSTLTVLAGGVHRAQDFYMARNVNPSIATEGWSPHHFLAASPESLLREFLAYRAVVLEHLAANTQCAALYGGDQIRRAFDVVHLKYLAPMLSPNVLDYIITESLVPGRHPREIVEGLWRKFVTLPESKISTKRFLYDLSRSLLGAQGRREFSERVSRLLRLAASLKYHHRLRTSLAPRLDELRVERTVRSGQRRCYRLLQNFLAEKLGEGSDVTTSSIADIIEHLDDYV
jgi:glycosyltransferase domain-containing protein